MKKKHLYIGLIIAALACYYTFRNVSFKELSEALASMHFIYLLPALFFFVVYYYIRALRWKYLLLSVKEVHHYRLFSPVMIGFMANMLPARLGELIRAYLLGKRENIPFSASFATIVVERAFDMSFILLMIGSLLFLQPELSGNKSALGDPAVIEKIVMFGWVGLVIVVLFFFATLLLIYKQDLVISWLKLLCRPLSESLQIKILDSLNSFTKALHVLKNFKITLIVILLSGVLWTFSLLTYYPFYYAFDLQYLPFSSLIILFIIICIFITIFPTPGFIGSFQAACMVGLHDVFGVPEATAASFGIVVWAFSMGVTAIGGIYFIIKDNISLKEISKAYS